MKRRLLALLLATMVLPGCAAAETAGGLTLLALNVGKADCLLLESSGSVYMIDTGTAESWGVVSSALRQMDIRRLDGVILTHTDKDHAGGLWALAQSGVEVGAWYASAYYEGVKEKKHPAVLAAAAVVFLLSARGLPARDAVTVDFGGIFRFDGQLTLTAAVLGGFLLLAAAALRLVSGGMAGLELILSVFLACSGAAVLYALIAQRRSGAFAPTALLVPVCFLVVQLIVTYRANARDSVLGHFYVELLLLAALCLASLYLAAFAYRCGAPRSFAPAAHLALTLAAACCVDMALARQLDGLAACLGAALLLLAYLEAAGDFEG